jgi:hypothetical protein
MDSGKAFLMIEHFGTVEIEVCFSTPAAVAQWIEERLPPAINLGAFGDPIR